MKVLKQLKIGDLIILAVLVVVGFTPFYFFKPAGNKSNSKNLVAVVKANNRQVKRLSLAHDQTWTYRDGAKINIVQVKKRRVRVIDANCKDQVCVKEGWRSKNGETIVCLPHKFLIEVRDESKNDDAD